MAHLRLTDSALSDTRSESKWETTGDGNLNLHPDCGQWAAGHCHGLPVLGLLSERDCAAGVEVTQRIAACSAFVSGWWILLGGRVQVPGERPELQGTRHTTGSSPVGCDPPGSRWVFKAP